MSPVNIESRSDALTGDNEPGKPIKKSFYSEISEDGWALWIGGLLITIVLLIAMLSADFKFATPVFQWSDANSLFAKVLSGKNLLLIAGIGFVFTILSLAAVWLSPGNAKKYIAGFVLIYILAILSLIIAGNKSISNYGIEYVVFALIIGLLLNNLNILPAKLKEAARSEFFIKTGLIILGTSILFTDIVKAGLPGILQALVVVVVVWFFALWLARKLKVDDEFAVILASAVSIWFYW